MRRRRGMALMVACFVVAVVLSACGDGDDAPPGRSEAAPQPSAGTAPAPSLAATGGISPGYGIFSLSGVGLDQELDGIAAAGGRWIRLDLHWGDLALSREVTDWSASDAAVRGARARGLEVILLPAYTPAWARPERTGDKHPPSDPGDYAAFVGAAVERYGPMGVHTWEVWNEPNLGRFWEPGPDPAAYARLLDAAGRAIRARDPAATILTAGLAPAEDRNDGETISPETFVEQLYRSVDRNSFDAVALHPYCFPAFPDDPSTSAWNPFLRAPLLHEIMERHGDGEKRIWATEFGAPTDESGRGVSPGTQAAMVSVAYEAWAGRPWTGPLLWYSYRDAGTDTDDPEDNFGLVRRDASPKPALAAFRRLMGR